MVYKPDFRNGIASGWPRNLNDNAARVDWGWNHKFGIPEIVKGILVNNKLRILMVSDTFVVYVCAIRANVVWFFF
jgi:hypothetical protein